MTSPTQRILQRVEEIEGVNKIGLADPDVLWLTEAVKELSQALEFYNDPAIGLVCTPSDSAEREFVCQSHVASTALAKVAGVKNE